MVKSPAAEGCPSFHYELGRPYGKKVPIPLAPKSEMRKTKQNIFLYTSEKAALAKRVKKLVGRHFFKRKKRNVFVPSLFQWNQGDRMSL
jgi:hypothetical protein